MKSEAAIMLCAGQRLDAASAGATGAEALAALREAIRDELVRHEVVIGYASASAGADIIFGEEVLARGGELHIFLPCPRDDFAEQYVAPAGEEWMARFRSLIASTTEVEISCEERLIGDDTLLRFNNQILQGMARIHAERLGGHARLLAVWSPEAPADPGSPADFMDQWPELEHLSLIDLDDLRQRSGGDDNGTTGDLSGGVNALAIGLSPLVVRAILFADMATYTSFSDEQVPLLWDFLAEVQQVVETRAKPPILINTWGDAVHAAAETALDLADYALALVETIAALDPEPFGLASRPRFRVALHAGPVYVGLQPLTGRSMVYGHHVNRAARIETVAAPGEAYASQHFVALLWAEMDSLQHEARLTGGTYRRPYRVEYVGRVKLPKHFGSEALYRILPAADAER